MPDGCGCGCACVLPTDLAVADVDGNVVEMTQTINGLFGCGAMVPGTGIMLNNTQNMFDPHPDMPHSVAPGKRVTSSMAPTIVLHPDGSPFFAVSPQSCHRVVVVLLAMLLPSRAPERVAVHSRACPGILF